MINEEGRAYSVEICDICRKEIARYKVTNDLIIPFALKANYISAELKIGKHDGQSRCREISNGYDICDECSEAICKAMEPAISDVMDKVFENFIEANRKEELDA